MTRRSAGPGPRGAPGARRAPGLSERGAPGGRRPGLAGLAAALCAVLIAGCSGGAAAHPAGAASAASSAAPHATVAIAAPAGPPPTTLAGYYAQKLHWVACDKGFQCARLLVPFDYQRPAWRRFSLPVIRLTATDPAKRIGSLVVNPGGPGGSGVSYALQARSVIAAPVRARFDVVGFDPRGVGGSVPAVHCMTGPQLDKYFSTNDTPANSAQLSAVVAESTLFARGCEGDSGTLLPYVGTRNAARDMDVLRAALGDAKLTYLGKSYGTYLGTWYAQLFPSHVRALVLDGAIDPGSSSLSMNIVQGEGFDVALRAFVADCVARAGCPLGRGSVSAGLARIQALLAEATAHPLINNLDSQPADGAMVLNGIATALYSQAYWPALRSALQSALAGDGTILVELANALWERNSSGQYSNLADANMAVECLDRPWPTGLALWRSAAAAAAKAAPVFGQAIMWGSLPCAHWPVRSYPLPSIRAAGAPPVLVVGNKRDPATPYRWAQALSRDLASGVLLGWNGNGHTAYMMGSTCVDGIVNRYLLTLAVPRNGTLCQ
ncbi:MAG TPA: alpha/beta hydrolase [Streptosporangiaceae bacterium]|nr:alpha/beta hydrolase [Streptosporangiaceae bacterium]